MEELIEQPAHEDLRMWLQFLQPYASSRSQYNHQTNVMLKTLEQKFPESIDGNGFHSFYHCREKRCSLNEPALSSSSKGETVRFTIQLLLNEKRMRKRFSLSFLVSQPQRFQECFRFPENLIQMENSQLLISLLHKYVKVLCSKLGKEFFPCHCI